MKMINKSSTLLIWSSYTIMLAMFLNCSSMMVFWIFLELNMVTFIMIMLNQNSEATSYKFDGAMFYFIVQNMGSILFLISASSDMINSNIRSILILAALTLKMGIYPLQTWLYKMSKDLSATPFLLILTTQKLSGILIFSMMPTNMIFMIVYASMLMGPFFIIKSKSTKELLISSSIYFTIWLWIMIQMSMFYFILMFTMYTYMTKTIIELDGNMKKSEKSNLKWFSTIMFLSGLPPMSMFFFKIYTMNFITNFIGQTNILLIWAATFVATMGYLKMFMPTIMMKKGIFNKITEKKSKIYETMVLMLGIMMVI